MTIMTKKKFCFRNGDEKVETQGNNIIETVPDWVAETELYQLAAAEESVLEVKATNTTKTVTDKAKKK